MDERQQLLSRLRALQVDRTWFLNLVNTAVLDRFPERGGRLPSDDLEDALVRKMFEVEDKMKPVDVVFWYEIFEWIGDLADYSKKTGSRLRLMIAHN